MPDRRRPTTRQRGYGSQYQRVRLLVLQRDRWRCVICGRPTNEVDHIVAVSQGGAHADPANLRALCRPHNLARRTMPAWVRNVRRWSPPVGVLADDDPHYRRS